MLTFTQQSARLLSPWIRQWKMSPCYFLPILRVVTILFFKCIDTILRHFRLSWSMRLYFLIVLACIGKLVIGKVKSCIVEFFDSEILNIYKYPQCFADKATLYFISSFPKLKVRFPYLFQQKNEGLQVKYNCRYKFWKRGQCTCRYIWIENYGTKKYLINYYVKLTFKSHSI